MNTIDLNDKNRPVGDPENADSPDRREAFRRLGKFAVYAAPFTVLAFTKKADAATGGGPHRH